MKRDSASEGIFELGSEEWAALPDLGVPAVLAKIDTGARTSALHATGVEVYATPDGQRVRFTVHPVAGRGDIARSCDAPLVARRRIASSNGARELRCVVATTVRIGARQWPIEVTLTNRRSMRFAMLLGRRAILDGMIVVPSQSNLQAPLERHAHATGWPPVYQPPAPPSGLRIGLLGHGPVGPLWQRLAEAAQRRGHVVERIDLGECRLVLPAPTGGMESGGRLLPRIDGVIALLEPGPGLESRQAGPSFALAVVRQLERSGTAVLNGADALARVLDRAHGLQTLCARRVPVFGMVLTEQCLEPVRSRGAAHLTSALVVGDRVIAGARHTPDAGGRQRLKAETVTAAERRLAIRAARALGAGFVRVDISWGAGGEMAVASFDASPDPVMEALCGFAKVDTGLAVIRALEARVRLAAVPVEG